MSIHEILGDQFARCAPQVTERVVNVLVDREVSKRADAIVKVLDKLAELHKDSFRIKADVVSFDDQGKVVSATWSKDQLEKKKKNTEQILKFERAIDKATDDKKPDMADVYNLANQGS